ncbi:hypothetical protein BV898_03399 [Hypsibius exemplaris]|uniref:Uncharacterized protein n=1 Tax=Hypsibius exemplaris TaxID=2072580 RepID=A0A1W0X532_HYPEX|nr:hypothetical protein BV898_03399 [Hypsibius exemplaris]
MVQCRSNSSLILPEFEEKSAGLTRVVRAAVRPAEEKHKSKRESAEVQRLSRGLSEPPQERTRAAACIDKCARSTGHGR